jgi:ABC-type phosphate transport system substrate-binding protein
VAVIVNKSNPVTGMTIVQLRAILLGGGATSSQVDDSVKVLTIDASRPGQPAYRLKLK